MTIFSKIIAGEIPSYKCAENEHFYAFLDLSDQELADMVVFAKKVALAIQRAFPCRKVGMAVLGLEVNHAHIHLVPLQSEGDMDFRKEKLQLSPETMQQTADKILAAM